MYFGIISGKVVDIRRMEGDKLNNKILFLFILLVMILLIPGSTARAVDYNYDFNTYETDPVDYIFNYSDTGGVLRFISSDETDWISNTEVSFFSGLTNSSLLEGLLVQVTTPSITKANGTLTIDLNGKAFTLKSLVFANSAGDSYKVTVTGKAPKVFDVLGNTCDTLSLPASNFTGIKSFTISWDGPTFMLLDNLVIEPLTTPIITTQPSNVTVANGGNTSFSVAAEGNTLTYQWQVDTTGVGDSFTNVTNGGVYSGAASATLNITGVTSGMNHYIYRCTVTNDGTYPLSSDNAALTLLAQAPTNIILDNLSIAENTASGVKVGGLTTTDPDSSSFTYSLVESGSYPDNAGFTLSGSDLLLNTTPNYEVKSSYNICIQTQDNTGLTYSKGFTIAITNVNEAPTNVTIDNVSIAENSSSGTTIGTLTGIDPDAGTVFTYSLVSGTGDADNGSFMIDLNALKLGVVPDYEGKNSYSIRVRVSDGALNYDKAFTVTITNVNEAPTGITLSSAAILEHSDSGTMIGTLTGMDPDAGSSFTYSLVSGTGDTDNLSFMISGNELMAACVPDFEAKNSYSIRIRVSDGSLIYDNNFTITVLDGNDPPTDITVISGSIAENSVPGSSVGTLGSTDNEGDTFTYSLAAGTGDSDNAVFSISGSTLKLEVSADYETRNSYSVRIRSMDNHGLVYEKALIILITNVNEAPTDIVLSNSSIAENSTSGTSIGTLTGTDPDAGSSFTYSLVSGTGDADNNNFTINGNALKLGFEPDYETKASYSIRIRVSDGALNFDKTFTVTITDVNEAPTDIALSNSSIIEKSDSGSTIGTLTGTDPDAGAVLGFSLPAGIGDNSSFTLTGSTLKLAMVPDYETRSSYNITVRVTDGALSFDKVFSVTITDANEAPTDLALSNNSIAENSAVGTTIGTLTGTDPDAGAVLSYSLPAGVGDNNSFTLTGSTLKLGIVPDFEVKDSYSIMARVSDGALNFDKLFTVTITDVNEAPIDITLSNASIVENAASGTMIGILTGSDPDMSASFAYNLVSGTGDTDNDSFTIDGDALKLGFVPDYETKNSYSIRASVSDGSLTYEKIFTITIIDGNDPPTNISITGGSIAENSVSSSSVGTLGSTDPNPGDTFTYSIAAGAGGTDNADFSITGSTLKLEVSADYETKNSYSVRIRSTDNSGLFYEKVLTILITDVNETPTDISLSNSGIAENSISGSSIGTLTGTDPDAGSSFTYSLVSGIGDTDNLSFTIDGSTLKLGFVPDYEAKNSYSIRVRVNDGAFSFDKVFAVTITNVNEVPTDIALSSGSIAENSVSDTTIGIFTGSDPDAGTALTYSLISGSGDMDNSAFIITGNELKLGFVPDYETKNSCSIRVRVSDGALSFDKAFTITITDMNEAPTNIVLANSSIAENSAVGMTIGSLLGTDPDAGASLTYALVSGTGDTDNDSFTIDVNTLKLQVVPDYETKNSYNIRVRVSDGALSFDKAFIITITNVNEVPTDIALSNAGIAENTASGTTVGSLTGMDPDAGSSFTYSLVSGTGDTDNSGFTIDGNALKLGFVPDYESKNSYTIRISVSDGSLTYEKNFTITIIDGNDPPTDITITGGSVAENAAIGTYAGTLGSTDPNPGDIFTYSIVTGTGGSDNANFSITGSTLKLEVSADYEMKNSYSVRIRSTDNNGLYYEKILTILITDVNEAPTDITLSNSSIAENSASGTTIGTLTGMDPDEGSSFTYTLVSGTGDTDNDSFTIDTNVLKLGFVPNYETKNSYSIRVRVNDGALSYDKAFTVTISNVNEVPTDIALSNSSIAENSASGTTIGTLTGMDPDAGAVLSYSLPAGVGDNDSFTLTGSTLKLATVPDYESKSSCSITVRVSDGALSFDKAFTIAITDVNEAPTAITLSNSSIAENTASGTTIGSLSGTDPDAGSSFTYSLVGGTGDTDNLSFTIDGSAVKLGLVPDYEVKNSYSIRVRVSDGALNFDKVFTITITNVNEAPKDLAISKANINENASFGTVVGTFTGVDEDAGDHLTFTLVSGSGSDDNSSFTLTGVELKLNTSLYYETKKTYTIRIRATDTGGLYSEKQFTITINKVNAIPTPTIERITLDVTNGSTDNSVVQIEVERTTSTDGKITDSITLEEAKAQETIEKLKEEGSNTARIIAPAAEENISEVTMTIPAASVDLLKDTDINMELETEDVRISIPNDSLEAADKESDENLYFKVVPLKDEEQRKEVTDRATQDRMLINLMGDNLSVIGSPMEIETNMPQVSVDIILPLTGITIPEGGNEREEFLSKLAVYVEHSDGEKEIIRGEIIEYQEGIFGLKFTVSKFSTFTIIKDERVKSDQCKILSMKLPSDAKINGRIVLGKVYSSASIKLKIIVSANASWKLYSDPECTHEIKNKLKPKLGLNKVYVKVTAEDGVSSQVYTIFIIRKK